MEDTGERKRTEDLSATQETTRREIEALRESRNELEQFTETLRLHYEEHEK